MSLVIAFDRKGGEIADCRALSTPGLPLMVLHWRELPIAMLQRTPGVSLPAFNTTLVQLIAHQFSLFASKRLLGETLELLCRKSRPKGQWPCLSEWLALLDSIKVNSISRLGQYREAAIYTLKQILRELPVLDYSASDFFERLYALNGVVVVVTSGLSVEMESFLASLFINYAYWRREGVDPRTLEPLCFVIDDAMPLVSGSSVSESEGGPSPLSSWAFMGRSRRMGLVVAAQNFSAISPALRNNCDTILCFGSYGRDAEELARHISLTREQAAVLPTLRPGEVVAIARATWPLALRGRFPEVP